MGGSTQQNQQQQTAQTSAQQTTPWAPAANTVSGILGNLNGINPNLNSTQQGAINQLSGLGEQGNPYAGGISNTVNSLLAGGGATAQAPNVNASYQDYLKQNSPFTNPAFLDPRNTPGFSDALNAMNSDITNQINGQFAGAGRDLSGMNTQALARGLSQGEGQLLANQYNTNVGTQLGAINSQYNAGNTNAGILSGLQQQAVANQQAGIGATDQANAASQYGPMLQLQAMSYQTGIPLQMLAAQMGIALPAGQAFGSTTGTQTGTQTGQTTTSVPLSQQLIGSAVGGAGLLGGLGWKPFGK